MAAALQRAAAPLPRLLQADGRKLEWQLSLRCGLAVMRAHAAHLSGRPAPLAELQQAAAAAQALAAGGARFNERDQLIWVELGLALGDALAQQRDAGAAQTAWHEALARLDTISGVASQRVNCDRAHLLQRLGRTQEARALADNLEATGFRHPLYADLQRRLGQAAR